MLFLASLIPFVGLVVAHGYVESAKIGGKDYTFYNPNTDPYMSPIPERISRPIPGNGPVEDVAIIDVQCNGYTAGGVVGSQPAALHAPAAAGSTVSLHWTLWPNSHVGPVLTYMARCPDTGCDAWEPGNEAVWFKVQQGGREGTSNTWATSPLMVSGNSGINYTIPSCLKPGYYLVRHEIIALHSAYQYPGAQFYPGCHQLQVTGSGSTIPSDLVGFPGAYSGSDAGITYDSYKAQTYDIPGPALFAC
ncbi:Fc.00g002580.m01.CDS01 [Cosmosporella sp. VM-42]